MDERMMFAILLSLPFGFLYIFVILLCFGIGGGLLSGYNLSVYDKKLSKEDKKYILRRCALVVFLFVLLIHVSLINFLYNKKNVATILGIMSIPVLIIGSILLSQNKKIKNIYNNLESDKDDDKDDNDNKEP